VRSSINLRVIYSVTLIDSKSRGKLLEEKEILAAVYVELNRVFKANYKPPKNPQKIYVESHKL